MGQYLKFNFYNMIMTDILQAIIVIWFCHFTQRHVWPSTLRLFLLTVIPLN